MKCCVCDKYLKRGHGINEYYYRGKYHYYCSLCLRIRNHNWRTSRRNKEWLSITSSATLGLAGLVWYLTPTYLIKDENLLWLPYLLATMPILIGLFIWFKWIQPYLEKMNSEEWEPLWKEQEKINKLEDYANSLNKASRCFCSNCLIEEWKKKNN